MPVVRAVVIRLFAWGNATCVVHAKGVRIIGAHIEEPLDFESATIICPLRGRGLDPKEVSGLDAALINAAGEVIERIRKAGAGESAQRAEVA